MKFRPKLRNLGESPQPFLAEMMAARLNPKVLSLSLCLSLSLSLSLSLALSRSVSQHSHTPHSLTRTQANRTRKCRICEYENTNHKSINCIKCTFPLLYPSLSPPKESEENPRRSGMSGSGDEEDNDTSDDGGISENSIVISEQNLSDGNVWELDNKSMLKISDKNNWERGKFEYIEEMGNFELVEGVKCKDGKKTRAKWIYDCKENEMHGVKMVN